MGITIKKAVVEDAPAIAPLFNAYRMFYGKGSNLAAAEQFIAERLRKDQSVIFVAVDGDAFVGFTQLYPVFSSVSIKNAWLLNDLYVVENKRKSGIATMLLEAAKQLGLETNSAWLMLQTATNNHAAQMAYKNHGWVKDDDYYVYTLSL